MKVIFAGTPEFAAVALQALHEAGFEIPLVLTQPDRPAGRGMHLQPSAVVPGATRDGLAQPVSSTAARDSARPESRRAVACIAGNFMGCLQPDKWNAVPDAPCSPAGRSVTLRRRAAAA